jgi:hypothetical protein
VESPPRRTRQDRLHARRTRDFLPINLICISQIPLKAFSHYASGNPDFVSFIPHLKIVKLTIMKWNCYKHLNFSKPYDLCSGCGFQSMFYS